MFRFLTTILLLIVSAMAFAQTGQNTGNKAMDRVKHLKDFQVIEFRRYTVKEGESATGMLRSAPELVILDPTRRSRLRWLTEEQK
jgi:hypothetical protein